MMFRRLLPLLPAAVLLAGCLFDGGGPRRLPEGHYELGGRFDDDYAYEQFFVVLDAGRWEWVEYGYNAATLELCQVSRRAGFYSVADTLLTLTRTEDYPAKVRCGFDAEDFAAMGKKAVSGAAPDKVPLRAQDKQGFEAYNFFGSTKGWQEYEKGPDPYGFH